MIYSPEKCGNIGSGNAPLNKSFRLAYYRGAECDFFFLRILTLSTTRTITKPCWSLLTHTLEPPCTQVSAH
jgi:hypothetical protein